MKPCMAGACALLLLTACHGKPAKINPFDALTQLVDSAAHPVDSLAGTTIDKGPVPLKADEIFDDFILAFATDRQMQLERIVFPLPFYNQDQPLKIEQKDWKFDPLFATQHYYTLFFDCEEDMDMVQDTSLTSVQFEWIEMKTNTLKKYYFERKKGAWMLEAINRHLIAPQENEDFIEFFHRFVNDSVFQQERVARWVTFVTNDPEDEFSILESQIGQDQWPAFRPALPHERLSNINYGQRNQASSATKILSIKGVDNNEFTTFYFRRRPDKNWELYKFEDLTN